MEISVIIPVFNGASFIERCVLSAVNLEPVKEVILIEDGSIDNTYAICEKLKIQYAKIVLLRHPKGKNKGVSCSRNLGIQHAKYELIAFLDADDYYLPNRFVKTKELFDNYKPDGIVEPISSSTNLNEFWGSYFKCFIPSESLFINLCPVGNAGWFHANGLTIRKECLLNLGGFNKRLKTSEDTLLWFQLAYTSNLYISIDNKPVAVRDQQKVSLTTDLGKVNKGLKKMFIYLIKWSYQVKMRTEYIELINKRYLDLLLTISNSYINGYFYILRNFLILLLKHRIKFIYKSKSIRYFLVHKILKVRKYY